MQLLLARGGPAAGAIPSAAATGLCCSTAAAAGGQLGGQGGWAAGLLGHGPPWGHAGGPWLLSCRAAGPAALLPRGWAPAAGAPSAGGLLLCATTPADVPLPLIAGAGGLLAPGVAAAGGRLTGCGLLCARLGGTSGPAWKLDTLDALEVADCEREAHCAASVSSALPAGGRGVSLRGGFLPFFF